MTRDNYRPGEKPSSDISDRVARAVASALNVDPLDIDPLYETVDPDALNELFQTPTPSPADGHVEFTMEGCRVVVYGTESVEVVPPEETRDSTENERFMLAGNSRQERQRTDGT